MPLRNHDRAAGQPTTSTGIGAHSAWATGTTRFEVWGTSAMVSVHPPHLLDAANRLMRQEITAFDRSCSRFRPDSELTHLNRSHGRPTRVSHTLFDAVEAALRVAWLTEGAVDPTVGSALVSLGYDEDFDEIARHDPTTPLGGEPRPAPGWHTVTLDRGQRTVEMPPTVLLDLGASAKALCVDRCAQRIVADTGASVLASIGGDLAVAGPPPPEGWSIAVVEDTRAHEQRPFQVIAVRDGAVASSSTVGRTWWRGGWPLHHIVDPRTGWPAEPRWRLVSVAAASCLDANAASTAAIVWGDSAPARLSHIGLPSRLVYRDGSVVTVAGWPADPLPAGSGQAGAPGAPGALEGTVHGG